MFRIQHFLKALLLTFIAVASIHADSIQNITKKSGSGKQQLGEQFAARMETLLARVKETSYQESTEIDEGKGVIKCDCSGLVGFVLRQQFPEAYLSLQGDEASWRKRPVSVTYYETFVTAGMNEKGAWKEVINLMDTLPGDVLAWRKMNLDADSTNGHTLLIASKPEKVEAGVRIRVIDSTRSLHERDTRPAGTNGVGAGYMTFLVDKHGRYSGHLDGKRSVTAIIAIGRLVQPTVSTSHPDDSKFVGLTKSNALLLAKKNGQSSRIIREDGKPEPLKLNAQKDRLNFVLVGGNVVPVFRG